MWIMVDFGVWPIFPGGDVGKLDRRVRLVGKTL